VAHARVVDVAVARSLVCEANGAPSDAILVENFDPDYLVFERATQLRRDGFASECSCQPGAIQHRRDQCCCARHGGDDGEDSRLGAMEIVPIREVEPISLNAATTCCASSSVNTFAR
jgi:hypothetical protein